MVNWVDGPGKLARPERRPSAVILCILSILSKPLPLLAP